MKIFSAQLKGTTTVVSGSTASITGSFTGSIAGIDINETNAFTASTIARLNSIETISSSNDSRVNSLEVFSSSIFTTNTFTSSASERLNALETTSASVLTLNSTQNDRLNSLETTSASVDTLNSNQNTRLNNLEDKTGSLATTGSNTFYGTQTFTGSVYIRENLIVQGSSSLQNITASAVDIGTNKIILNVDNPAVRFAGISVYDSGSTQGTGSLWWDSTQNHWLYEHPSDSAAPYNSAILISGPKNTGNLGEELELVNNYIVKAVGGDHISSSAIYDDGTTISLKSNTEVTGSLKILTSSDGTTSITIGNNNVSGIIESPANVYINADSNNDDANGLIQLGFNRTGFAGGIPVVTIKETNSYGTGSVGIGTTSVTWSSGGTTYAPLLSVDGGSGNILYLKTTASGSTSVTINSPGYFLSGDSAGLRIFDITNGNNNLQISTLNNLILVPSGTGVGIGTTAAPSYKLDVIGDVAFRDIYVRRSSNNDVVASQKWINSGDIWTFTNANGGPIRFASNLVSNIMQLSANGNVGINTVPSSAKFHVSGSISSERGYNGMDDGLVLHLPFSENTGTTAIDRSQTGFTATLTNGATWGSGILGYGAVLDGINDYISVAAPTINIPFGTNMSYSMWINISSFSGKTRQYLIDTRGDGGDGGMQSYFLFDYVAPGIVTFTTGNSGAEVISQAVGMPTGVWHHVVATRSGSTWKIYLNGVEIKSGTSDSTSLTLSNTFRVGTYSGAGAGEEYYLKGSMDEVKIYKRTLSTNEIALQYYEGIPELENPTYTEIPYGNITYSQTNGSPWGINNSFPSGLRDYTNGLVVGTSSYTYNVNINRGVTFDLGSPKAVRKMIEIGYDISNVDSYTVQYSNDNSNWNTIGVFPYFMGNPKKDFIFNQYGAVYARYWRWFISGYTERNTNTNYYTYETAIYT